MSELWGFLGFLGFCVVVVLGLRLFNWITGGSSD